ncbi:cupin domain-containing protein [Fretibacter rubidus]|uniref:cupin domain-containing protein n=1 Tax=Fretibacter rubidus TaxID=570162 RepID=UPI00352A00AB
MTLFKASLIAVSITALGACVQATPESKSGENGAAASQIISQSETAADAADWGTFYPYFTDDTHVLKPVLVGVAKIKAGEQIHHPHRHADEEYLMVTAGRGTWSLNGVDRPAKTGDILFARAWDYHGITAADDSPLEFVVFKYSGRHIDAPADPQPDLPEEQIK